MSTSLILAAYVLSSLAAIAFVLISINRNKPGRILFAALFCWGAYKNFSLGHTSPNDYVSFNKYAVGLYHDFIIIPFSNNITSLATVISVCMLLIAIGLLCAGRTFRISCIAGMILMVVVSPLGILSAFPGGLIWATGLFALYRNPFDNNIFHTNRLSKAF